LVKIPITEAKSFNENLNILEVYPVFALTKDENFVIDQISIKNPILNKTYLGSVNATESFSSTQLSLDFAPIETYIDKYKKNDNAQLRPSSVKAKKSILDTNIPLTDKKKGKDLRTCHWK
jgi:hypothetical protein